MISENLGILRKYIKNYRITQFEQVKLNLKLKIEIIFKDDSILFIKEIIINGEKRKYAYHWQDKDENLICRWDNAPDWKEIDTFPHHKHYDKTVFPSYSVDSKSIFEEIKEMFQNAEHKHKGDSK